MQELQTEVLFVILIEITDQSTEEVLGDYSASLVLETTKYNVCNQLGYLIVKKHTRLKQLLHIQYDFVLEERFEWTADRLVG